MNQDTLHELFLEQIRDIYDAEKQLVKALPKLAKAASSADLTEAIEEHLEETKGHVTRLEIIFEMNNTAAKGKPCNGMKGLIQEGGEAAEEEKGPLRDLAIIGGAQRVEHYEISAYGTARTIAEQLGMKDAVDLLQKTEGEESEADAKLTDLAMGIYQSEAKDSEEDTESKSEEEEVAVATAPKRSSSKAASGNAKRK